MTTLFLSLCLLAPPSADVRPAVPPKPVLMDRTPGPVSTQVTQPIPIDVDRTRFLCWELVYPGDKNDPEYQEYWKRTMAHWEGLKGVVGEDIGIYDQLARTKQASGYREHILSARECKIHRYHETMAQKIRD